MAPIVKKTISEQVVSHVREAILNEELFPGDMVSELGLAKELSISQAPVREAIQTLIADGFITTKGKRRKYITKFTANDIRNRYFIGGVLEGAVVATSIDRFTDDKIRKLDSIIEKMRLVAESKNDIDSLGDLDLLFHNSLFSSAQNEFVRDLCFKSCRIIGEYFFHNRWKMMQDPRKVYKRHNEIVNAIKARKPELIESVIRKHYSRAGELIAQYIEKNENNI